MITLTHAEFEIELPNPELGNSLTHKNAHNIQRSMNGTLHIYKRKSAKEIRWDFKGIRRSKIIEFQIFLGNVRGKIITVLDYNAEEMTVKILGIMSSTETSRGNCEAVPDLDPEDEIPLEIIENLTSGDFSLLMQKVV